MDFDVYSPLFTSADFVIEGAGGGTTKDVVITKEKPGK